MHVVCSTENNNTNFINKRNAKQFCPAKRAWQFFAVFRAYYQSGGKCSIYVGMARVKSHVIHIQNASKLGENA